ncbi:hypothetical protein OCK74_27705 [Chitinophagaceae bacterium LB-8]|uniref:Uncharacterized protein n=1 Tax=Paraflavisolibacter caeni TaxID=2982496 RepID=A0A9X2Y1A0_9BACT|nr:hypothetical protein [Paraflavisolibacter caeni]MCU7552931.1 hypothetical protein [Paraflavisolibacter caeni]
MKLSIQKEIARYKEWRKGVLMLSLPELLLLTVVSGLFIIVLYVCTKSTKGALSITALKNYLNDLQIKFKSPLTINAETERSALEILLNDVKTSCDRKVISSNIDLEGMFDKTCKQIKSITESKEVGTRSSWQKLKDLSSGFNEFYFLNINRTGIAI